MNRRRAYILKVTCWIILLCLFGACRNQSGTSKQSAQDSINALKHGNSSMESVYYRFPTPNEIFDFIKNERLKFDQELLNPKLNGEKYLNSKNQTVALGTYVADLAYITLFEAYNLSSEYYKIVHNLSEKIRITSAYDLEVAQRIEKNLLNVDSLKTISVDSYSSMVEYLVVNNREKTLAMIAAGAYIECFYIAFTLAGNYTEKNPMIAKIVDLKYAFENLYSYLQIYSDDPSVKELAGEFSNLNAAFTKMQKKELGKTTVKQNTDGSFVLGGGSQLVMDKATFEIIRKEVFKMRKLFVESY
jgi:hypothetical protein